MATGVADVALKDAKKLYPKAITKVNYKGNVFHYCTVLTLGEGTFGKVYKGWRKDGEEPLAVKIINQSHLKQDFKARENLEREVSILKIMKGCDNVVQIFIAAQMKDFVIIAMEMCDCDLSKLLSEKISFSRKEAVDFLHQLGEGMKELRKQNIVHRDIKPQNILIKYREQRTIFKLADFGYARHFDASRTAMMNSIVGTPLYMAPEALEVYLYPNKQSHYTDKVDVWSIGALLYKVLVGKDAFPAHSISDVYRFLRSKKDNIAFELPRNSSTPVFLDELPENIQKKLNPAFVKAITELLVGTLKFDQKERFSFPILFQKIEDIIESKVELINVLHGTSLKLIQDECLTPEVLIEKAASLWSIPSSEVVIFSTEYHKYIASHLSITDEEFRGLIEKSGGSEGHVRLYVMSVNQIKMADNLTPDTSCFEPLKSAIDQKNTEYLITNLRFTDEIIYMAQCMEKQLENQHKSVETLYQFTINETGMSSSLNELKRTVQQALAQVSLMVELVGKDLELCDVRAEDFSLPELLRDLVERESQLRELESLSCIPHLQRPENPFKMKDCQKKVELFITMTKRVQLGSISDNCDKLYQFSQDMLRDKTNHTRLRLATYASILESTWALYSQSSIIQDVSKLISQITSARHKMYQEILNPPSSPDRNVSMSSTGTLRDYTSMLYGLRAENESLKKKLSDEMSSSVEHKRQYDEAMADLQSSRLSVKEREIEEEVKKSLVTYDMLCEQLAQFCKIGGQVVRVKDSGEPEAGCDGSEGVNEALLLKARDMATEIRDSISFIRTDGIKSAEDRNDVVSVKLAHPDNYKEGDIVLMTPVNTLKSGALPSILHLNWKTPYMLMNFKCLQPMGIKPGRVPQLFLAKLTEDPQKLDLKKYPQTAQDIGQSEGVFYRATVKPISAKFSASDLCLLSPDKQQHSIRAKASQPS